jgi:hypothetical protein
MSRRPLLLLLGDSLTQNGTDAASGGWICLLQHRYSRSADVLARGLSGYNTKYDAAASCLPPSHALTCSP